MQCCIFRLLRCRQCMSPYPRRVLWARECQQCISTMMSTMMMSTHKPGGSCQRENVKGQSSPKEQKHQWQVNNIIIIIIVIIAIVIIIIFTLITIITMILLHHNLSIITNPPSPWVHHDGIELHSVLTQGALGQGHWSHLMDLLHHF